MVELVALGIVAGLIALVIWLSKGSGYKDAEIDVLEAKEKTNDKIQAKIKQIDTKLANTSDSDKLRNRKYRD